MIYYISSIGISYLFFRFNKYRNKTFIGLLMCMLILSLIAGFRAIDVGADTKVYSNFFLLAKSSSSFINYKLSMQSEVESGFLLLTWVIGKLGMNWTGFLFSVNFLNNFFILESIYLLRDRINLDIALLLYMFIFWPYSLNIMRQSLGMSLVLYGITLLVKNKKILSMFAFLCAISFHKSSVFFVALLLLLLLFLYFENNFVISNVLFGLFSFIFILFRYQILHLIENLGFLGEKYGDYFNSYGVNSGFSFFNFLFIFVPFLIISFHAKKSGVFKDKKIYLLAVMIFVGIVMNLLTRINYIFFFRTALYMLILQIIYYSFVIKNDKYNKVILSIVLVVYMFSGFFIMFVLGNYGALFPYHFQ